MIIELDSDIGQAETKISNSFHQKKKKNAEAPEQGALLNTCREGRVDKDTRFADIEVEEGETIQW